MVIHQAMWAMKHYGDNGVEWPLERKFEEMAVAGFSGIFGSLPSQSEESVWRKLMNQHQFSFGLETFPSSAKDLKQALVQARNLDVDVLYVNAQVKDAFTIDDQAINLIHELYEEADRFDVPFFVETHRGRITQDLIRTSNYLKACPELALTIDFSHYILAGEMYDFTLAEPLFNELLERTASIHARVTNSQQIQIDIGEEGDHPMVLHFLRWWKTGIRYWLQQARPGDVLPFVCEIGHHYSVTPDYLPSAHSDQEYSDRWAQSLLFKRLAEQLWLETKEELK